MNNKKRVLITGIGGPAGKAAATYFHERNYFIIGMDMNDNVTTVADEFYKAYPAKCEHYLSQLLTLAENENVSLVIPTVSEELPELSRKRYEFLRKGIMIYISPYFPTCVCDDKYLTSRILTTNGIAVPYCAIPEKGDNYPETILSKISFPVLAKPRISRGGRGITIYYNKNELEKETRQDIIFQEFASGDEFDLNLCIDSQKPHRILASRVLKKTSLKNGIIGNAQAVKRVCDTEVKRLGEQAALRLGLIGPLDIDIRKNDNGAPVILEINTRLGANCLAAPEILDALLWMWLRDSGHNDRHFVISLQKANKMNSIN